MNQKLALSSGLMVLALASLAVALGPTAMQMPMTVNTGDSIGWIYAFQSNAPWITLLLAVAGVVVFVALWRKSSGAWMRFSGVIPLLALLAAAVLARQYLVERMFEPIETISFVAAASAEHVADDELVISVAVGEESRAYPVLMMAYYHIVNDRLEDQPFAVTY